MPNYHGQGPRLFIPAGVFACLCGAAARIWPDPFYYKAPWSAWIGWTLLAPGCALFLGGLVFMARAVRSGRLETRGPFALVRHPMYAAWALFLFPGLALAGGAWLILGSSLLVLVGFNKRARAEELALEKTFGREYLAYKAKTPRLVPLARPGD